MLDYTKNNAPQNGFAYTQAELYRGSGDLHHLHRPLDMSTCAKVMYAHWINPVHCLEFPL